MPMFSDLKVTKPRPRKRKRVLHAFNVPPIQRIQKTTLPRPRRDRKSGYRLKATTRVVSSTEQYYRDPDCKVKTATRMNADAPIRDPEARTIHRLYTPERLNTPKRPYPMWDQTLAQSEAHRTGASQMIQPFTIRRKKHGKKPIRR
jgi:hypothetical protein